MRIFPKIVATTRSEEAWDIIEMTYSERGRNTNQHQAELQSVAVVDEVTIFNITKIIEVVEEPNETKEDK